MSKGKTRGRPRNQGKRTTSGRISRAGKVVKGSTGTRLRHARPMLGVDDRTRLEMLVVASPARMLAAGLIQVGDDETAAEVVEREREVLFAKAEHAANAVQRRDPIGRAWHEGLLDGQGVDPEVLRDIGRQFGFLYWHEYRAVDATLAGYSDMVALGSVKLASAGRDALGQLFKVFSQIIDALGRPARDALDRLCVNDMWFAEGPDWLDRLINTQRLARDPKAPLAGDLARKGDEAVMKLALSALVALARGGAVRPVKVELDHPVGTGVSNIAVMSQDDHSAAIDPRFIDGRGFMRPMNHISAIILNHFDFDKEEPIAG